MSLPKRNISELIEALRVRALALTGAEWERGATRDMMNEAAQALEDFSEPLYWHLKQEVIAAHDALDRLGAPKTAMKRKRGGEETQEMTLGIKDRFSALAVPPAPPTGPESHREFATKLLNIVLGNLEWVRAQGGKHSVCPLCHCVCEQDGGPGHAEDCPRIDIAKEFDALYPPCAVGIK